MFSSVCGFLVAQNVTSLQPVTSQTAPSTTGKILINIKPKQRAENKKNYDVNMFTVKSGFSIFRASVDL